MGRWLAHMTRPVWNSTNDPLAWVDCSHAMADSCTSPNHVNLNLLDSFLVGIVPRTKMLAQKCLYRTQLTSDEDVTSDTPAAPVNDTGAWGVQLMRLHFFSFLCFYFCLCYFIFWTYVLRKVPPYEMIIIMLCVNCASLCFILLFYMELSIFSVFVKLHWTPYIHVDGLESDSDDGLVMYMAVWPSHSVKHNTPMS